MVVMCASAVRVANQLCVSPVNCRKEERKGGRVDDRASVLPSDTADVARAAASDDDAVISAGKVKGRQSSPISYNLK